MNRSFARFCAAWIFLTRIPLPRLALDDADFAEAPRHYPLVGLIIGALAAAAYVVGNWLAGQTVAAFAALAATLLATGAFHEDGLADLFDGLGASSREHMLEIMRDSRLGTFGTSALFVVLGLKVAALASMPFLLAIAVLPLAHGLSRLSAVVAIATSRYVREEGAAKPVAWGISRGALAVAMVTGIIAFVAFALAMSGGLALVALAGLILGHVATRLLFERKLGGYTGDCLGAVQQLSELGIYLAIIAWL
ncbi:adenosylcobinamide-GDP ribazoletransferase [Parasphingopyxis sp.]|uniref:adenosylcobinamide-GDP ribazoletransferase n=1 Tax=Parasphingopyxis sp. TaxID=1920299 RepID=UPI002612E52F|nr:adenosylcobinamide-GDP ribazoletransferase [Parasphingopyxis sp.]